MERAGLTVGRGRDTVAIGSASPEGWSRGRENLPYRPDRTVGTSSRRCYGERSIATGKGALRLTRLRRRRGATQAE